MRQKQLQTYADVLDELPEQSHLLLGNGFNNSLGIKTEYENILEKMKEKNPVYKIIETKTKQCNYNIETIIGELKNKIQKDDSEYANFLSSYINKKVKSDFMQAVMDIIEGEIKNVYQEKNQNIYLLLKNFENYFTLNYDPFLYLLLMKFKGKNNNEALAIQNTLPFQEEHLNTTNNDIYKEIKMLHDEGILKISISNQEATRQLNQVTKQSFMTQAKEYFKTRHPEWRSRKIEKSVGFFWEQKDISQRILDVNDGFRKENSQESLFPAYNEQQSYQNLFFLHGAFHIFKRKERILKITSESHKALYKKLEETINSENEDIVVVLKNDDKIQEIRNNNYLNACYKQLLYLEGSLIILGCSLSDNDKHIFDQINKSKITTIYISVHQDEFEKYYQKSQKIFNNKKIVFFDRETISYSN